MPTERLKSALEALDEAITVHQPALASRLRPGVSSAELDTFESDFGHPIPHELRVLYEWHDGGEFGHSTTLPGLGRWLPLFTLIDACAGQYDLWEMGFNPYWVPFSIAPGPHAHFVIDASQAPDDPAPVLRYASPDGVEQRVESLSDMVEEITAVLSGGLLDESNDYELTWPPDPQLVLFGPERDDLDPGQPDDLAVFRFAVGRRFDHELDASSEPMELADRLSIALREIAELANSQLGTDAGFVDLEITRALKSIDKFQRRRDGRLLGHCDRALDLAWRAFQRSHLQTAGWTPVWSNAEQLTASLLQTVNQNS